MKLKMQGPSLVLAPSKALAGSAEMPLNLTAFLLKKFDRGFPKFDNNHKNLHYITNNEL